MRSEDRRAVAAELAADFPLFARSTIERWVDREAEKYAGEGVQASDSVSLVGGAVRATLEELSRGDVATSRELPLAPSISLDREADREPAG